MPKYVTPDNLSYVTSVERALPLLTNNRIDIYVDVEKTVDGTLKGLQSPVHTAIYKAGIMESVSTHAYLNARHKDLAPIMSAILRNMKMEGLVEQYHREIFKLNSTD